MMTFLHQKKLSFFYRLSALTILLCFLGTAIIPPSLAQEAFLPVPGTMVHLSDAFNPPLLKGIKVYPDNPFHLDFILNNGNGHPEHSEGSLQQESIELVKYFLTSVTVPEADLWVNLSPYEKDRIVPHAFGTTQMGRDLLAQDYLLKQMASSLTNPETDLGKKFWDQVNKAGTLDAGRLTLGKTPSVQPPATSDFNKVWILPEKAVIYETKDAAYVVETHLKVMLEEDYEQGKTPDAGRWTLEKNSTTSLQPPATNVSSQIFRTIILPILEKEVNEGKNFAQLRQIYHSLILAIWFKDKIKQSIFGQAYVDHNKISGVDIADKTAKEKIWAQYVESFKKGAYNYIKEEVDPLTQETLPRKYFSGGAGLNKTRGVIQNITVEPKLSSEDAASSTVVTVDLAPAIDDNFETVPSGIRQKYKIIRWLDGGGSSAGVLLVKDLKNQTVVLKFANWAGIGSNGTFWLKAQVSRLKELRNVLPPSKKERIPQIYDYFENIDPTGRNGLVYYTMEYIQHGAPLSLFYWDHPENTANQFLADLNEIVTFLSNDLYALGALPVPAGYIKRVHRNRLTYRLNLLRQTNGPVYERLIRDNKLSVGEIEYQDITALFEEIWKSDTIIINGKEYPNATAILKGLEKTPDLFKLVSLPQYGHGDALLRNFMKMPDTTPSKIFDVRGIELPENSPDRVDIPYELGKMLHGILLEVVRKNNFSIGLVRQTNGRLSFILNVDAANPAVKTFFQVRSQMPELFKHNKALNEVLKNEPNWLKKAIFAEATHFLADAVNRLENDKSGRHAIAYYLLGVMLMQNIMNDDFSAFKEPTFDSIAATLASASAPAMAPGGIDLTGDKMRRQLTTTGNSVEFKFTPEMIDRVQSAPGFVPVIINMQPLTNLPLFLGLKENEKLSATTSAKL